MLKIARHVRAIYQWSLVPLTLILIYISALHVVSTFFALEKYRHETIWSLEYLNREIESTIHESRLYLANASTRHQLHSQYQALHNRLLIVGSNLTQDPNLSSVPNLDLMLHELERYVQSMNEDFINEQDLTAAHLKLWISSLEQHREKISYCLINNISASKGYYTRAVWQDLLNALLLVGLAILSLLVIVGHLIYVLIQEQNRQRNQIEKDSLTGLYSRQFMMNKLNELCQKKSDFCIVFLDLNKFKNINDNYGHPAGDQLLIQIAHHFKNSLEKLGSVGRIGGDEFLWLIPYASPTEINEHYQQIVHSLSMPLKFNDQQLPASLSAGAVSASACNYNPSLVLEYGDTAMYWAKTTHSTSIVWYEEINQSKTLAASIS